MAERDDKTEAPTGKRLDDARAKGDVPLAPEMRTAAMFVAMLVVTGALGMRGFAHLSAGLAQLWDRAEDVRVDGPGAQAVMSGLLVQIALALGPVFLTLVAFAVLGNVAHGLPAIVPARLAPQWGKLSPMAGFKRLIGPQQWVETGKTVLKLAALLTLMVVLLRPRLVALDTLIGADPAAVGASAGALVRRLIGAVAIPVVGLALFDLVYQRRAWMKKLRMSKQEIKDEYKQSEGDPKIKGKIRQIGYQRARRRMIAAVKDASVVITNPTHFAVALRYEHGKMGAPVVVAKGVDALALRIRAAAAEAGVPVVENRPLARALHASADLDRPIPVEHYAAVAEIIGYVMRLARRRAR